MCRGRSSHFDLGGGGCTVADPDKYFASKLIIPEILGDKLNLNFIWHRLPFKFLDMCQKRSCNSQSDLKISSIEDTRSGRLCHTSFQKPPPPPPPICHRSKNALILKTPFNVLPQQLLRMCLNENYN